MSTKDIIRSQYLASLEMLNQAILQCPGELWDDASFPNQFWQIAYHVLFYTHLYLQPTEEDFVSWGKHKKDYHTFEGLKEATPDPGKISPYAKEEVLEYLEFCRREVYLKVESLDLEAESGFYWLPFNKMELQFYNIRHLQHHTGDLSERLGTNADIHIRWVGMVE
jgi:hypothetical protein